VRVRLEKIVQALRRGFVAVWIALSLAGALKLGAGGWLLLPHLRYGHVMFNKNPSTVTITEYAREDGVRHPIAELMTTPSLGYHRARAAVNLMIKPEFLLELCFRTLRSSGNRPFDIFVDEYDVLSDPRRPARSHTVRCEERAFAPR
jgi:hypothetical protein